MDAEDAIREEEYLARKRGGFAGVGEGRRGVVATSADREEGEIDVAAGRLRVGLQPY